MLRENRGKLMTQNRIIWNTKIFAVLCKDGLQKADERAHDGTAVCSGLRAEHHGLSCSLAAESWGILTWFFCFLPEGEARIVTEGRARSSLGKVCGVGIHGLHMAAGAPWEKQHAERAWDSWPWVYSGISLWALRSFPAVFHMLDYQGWEE